MKHPKFRSDVCIVSCVGKVEYTRTALMLRALTNNGYRIAAISPGDVSTIDGSGSIVHYAIPLPQNNFWYGAGFLNTSRTLGQRLKNSFYLMNKVMYVRPRIIICSEPDAWIIAVLAKWWLGCRVVVDLREVYHDRALAFPYFTQRFVSWGLRSLMRALSRFTDEVIHVSVERQQVYDYLHKLGVIIGSYPELDLFPRKNFPQLDVSNDNLKPVVAIHVGALRSTYASDQLLEAMQIVAQKMPVIRFVVLGGVAGDLQNTELLQQLTNAGILEFIEQVPFHEVVRRLYTSDIGINLVLPIDTAHRLAAPQKLYEYMAASLPIVGANVVTIQRVITDYECGLPVAASRPDEIATALIHLAQDPQLRQKLGRNARQAAETEFNWEGQASKLITLIESLK